MNEFESIIRHDVEMIERLLQNYSEKLDKSIQLNADTMADYAQVRDWESVEKFADKHMLMRIEKDRVTGVLSRIARAKKVIDEK